MSTPIELLIKYTTDYKDAIAGTKRVDAEVDTAAKNMSKKTDVAAKQMSESTARATKEMANHLDQLSFRSIMVGNALTFHVTVPLMALAAASMKAYMEMDSLSRGLTVVMGSSRAASREMERLADVAKLPGLGLREAYQGSLNLQAVGLSAREARDTMMAFGNALGTVGKGKAELAAVQEQIMQIVSKGKVMTEDIRIIRSYVPQITQAMGKAFGTSNVEDIAGMGVTGKEFVDRIVAELKKLPQMTGGIKNDMENAADSINKSLAKIGEDIAPTVAALVKDATSLFDVFTKLPEPVRKFMLAGSGLIALVGPIVAIVGQYNQLRITLGLLRESLEATKTAQVALTAAEATGTATSMTAAEVKKILALAEKEVAAAEAGSTVATKANTLAIKANALASSKLVGFFQTLPGAATAAIIGITALTYSVQRYTAAAEEAAKKAADLGDKWYSKNEEKIKESLKGKSDEFLRNQLNIISGDIERERKRLQELKEKGDWGRWFTSGDSAEDILRAKSDVPIVEENLKRLDQQWEVISEILKNRKNGKDAAEDQVAVLSKQVTEFEVAAAKAAQIGDKAGEEWAKINANYLKKLEENVKRAQEDKAFDKVAADMLAYEEYLADKFRLALKEQAKKREDALQETLSTLDRQAAVARLQGNELEAAKIEALREYHEAYAAATEIDPDTGKYKYSDSVRQNKIAQADAEYWVSVHKSIKDATEEAKQEAKKAVDEWRDYKLAAIEGARLEAEAMSDAVGEARAEAERLLVEGFAEAQQAAAEGKSGDYVKLLLDNSRKRAQKIIADARDEEAKNLRDELRNEQVAKIQTAGVNYEIGAASMKAALEQETDPSLRLNLVAEMGRANELATQQSVLADLIVTRAELNALAEKGIDITERANLAQAKANKTMAEAAAATEAAIKAEIDRQTEAVDAKIKEIRREDDERQRAFDNETRRRRDLTRFASGEDVWRNAVLGGINEMWGKNTALTSPSDYSQRPATDRETITALDRLRDEQMSTNRNLQQIRDVLNSKLGGQIGAFGR
jgi:tape measure domain-containing protein